MSPKIERDATTVGSQDLGQRLPDPTTKSRGVTKQQQGSSAAKVMERKRHTVGGGDRVWNFDHWFVHWITYPNPTAPAAGSI